MKTITDEEIREQKERYKEEKISVISNAIGFELKRHEAEPNADGILSVMVTDEEADFCRRAAERVYRQAIEGRD